MKKKVGLECDDDYAPENLSGESNVVHRKVVIVLVWNTINIMDAIVRDCAAQKVPPKCRPSSSSERVVI